MKKKKMKIRILCILVGLLLILGMVAPAMACSIDFGAAQDSANQAAGQIIQEDPWWAQRWAWSETLTMYLDRLFGRWK